MLPGLGDKEEGFPVRLFWGFVRLDLLFEVSNPMNKCWNEMTRLNYHNVTARLVNTMVEI